MRVLMIIPAYNEEESIFDTVTSILNYRKKVDFDLDYVVINDGSTDKTKQILEDNHFNAVNLVMNLGIGGAVQTGYKYALEHDYDVAVQFDGDGQHDIESLSDLLEPIRKNEADLVIGSRFVGDVKSEFQTTFMRRFGISVISNLIKWTTGQRVLDTTSGYRLADKDVIKQFAKRYPIKADLHSLIKIEILQFFKVIGDSWTTNWISKSHYAVTPKMTTRKKIHCF